MKMHPMHRANVSRRMPIGHPVFRRIPDSVSVVVKALPTDKDPYEVTSWLSTMSVNPNSKKPAIAYVHVRKGYSPVNSAIVMVTVERPHPAKPVKVEMKDDGSAPDTVANDGVYTAAFTKFSGNKRYSWDVDVKTQQNENDMVLASFPQLAKLSMARARYLNATPPVVIMKAEKFTRTSSCGAMDVTGYKAGKDYYAPSRITDLTVVLYNSRRRLVTLTWTAPGDDLNEGTASSYEFRSLPRFNHQRSRPDDIRMMFQFGRHINPSNVLMGSFTPNSGGTKEKITLRIPKDTDPVFLAMRARDDVGHIADVSNVVTITFKERRFAINSSYVATTTTAQPSTTTFTEGLTTTSGESLTTISLALSPGNLQTKDISSLKVTGQLAASQSHKESAKGPNMRRHGFTETHRHENIYTRSVTRDAPTTTTLPNKSPNSFSQKNNFNRKTYGKLWSLEPKDNQAKDKSSAAQTEDVFPQSNDNGRESTTRKRGPSSVLIGIIVSSTIGLIIVVAVVAVVVSKLIVTKVHATSDVSMRELETEDPVPKPARLEKPYKPPPSPVSISNLL